MHSTAIQPSPSGASSSLQRMIGTLAAIWGVAGVVLLLSSAVYRLSFPAVATFSYPLGPRHWLALAVSIVTMGFSEGYRGFQQGFSPRVAARARYLRNHPRALHALLAPLFCMGYFHAVRRRKIVSFSVTAGIVVLVVLVRALVQPWRGIVDLGVVLGLVWGIVSILPFAAAALTAEDFGYSPDVPDDCAAAGEAGTRAA